MSDDSLEDLERQIASVRTIGSPMELRAEVLTGVARELRAARWDRRMARAAAVLLVVGIGLNLAAVSKSGFDGGRQHVATGPRQSLVDTAVVVAEATDAWTGRQYARQLAAMIGHKLTEDEGAAIDAAVQRSASHGTGERKG